jgi:hypothetical protein
MPEDNGFPEEYCTAIGEVVFRWNSLEFLINIFLIHLLGKDIGDPRSHVIFAHMAFPQKLDVLSSLCEEVKKKRGFAKLKKYKETVLPLIKKAQAGRNWVIHSDWGAADGKVRRGSITARGSFKYSSTVTTLKEIEAVNQSIEEARGVLAALVKPAWNKQIVRRAMRLHKEDKT